MQAVLQDATAVAADDVQQLLNVVSAACPARPQQLRTLINLIARPLQPLPGSILLFDACSPSRTASYGKAALRAISESRDSTLIQVAVSPLSSTSATALFRDILRPLEAKLGSPAASASSSRRADGSLDWFLWRVTSILAANPTARIAFLVENAERMRDIWAEPVWSAFCRLGELTGTCGRITAIFVSSLPWSNFRTPSGLTTANSPIVISFPRHTKDEVLSILSRDFDGLYAAYHKSVQETQMRANTALGLVKPDVQRILKRKNTREGVDQDSLRKLYSNYLGLFYDSVSSHVRDVTQMRMMSAAVWHGFVVPVQAGEAATTDNSLLLLASAHLFRDVLVRLQTSEVGPKEWAEEARYQSIRACEERLLMTAQKAKQARDNPKVEGTADGDTAPPPAVELEEPLPVADEETKIDQEEWRERDDEKTKRRRLTTQLANTSTLASLPLIPTFLLLSAFLASYNPSRLDLRYFLRDSALAASSSSGSRGGGGRKFGPGRGKRTQRRGRPPKNGGTMVTNEDGQLENLNRQELLGPKAFPIDRLLAIFQALITECGPELNAKLAISVIPPLDGVIEEDDGGAADISTMWEERARSAGVYAQINNLLGRRMLVRTSAQDKLAGAVNLRVNVGYGVVSTLARKVRFDLDEWLWDWGGGAGGAA